MKLTSSKFNARGVVGKIPRFARAHYGGLLLCLFFATIALWAFVFWKFGISPPRQTEDVNIRIVKVKEADLRKITDDIKEREKAYNSVSEKIFSNPFIKFVEVQ